jgi:hypothetical protein
VSVDFPEVMRNAAKEGIDLQEITIKYENLTPDEIKVLESRQIITNRLPGGGLLAKFPKEGEPLFPDKATAVLYLGA